jgi:hypothetical protein
MERFQHGQRVKVRTVTDECIVLPDEPDGHVYRLRRADDGAWVRLDRRSDVPGVHPFPEDDTRGRDVLVYQEDCCPINSRETRKGADHG